MLDWKNRLNLKEIFGFREHSKFNERLRTVKELKNNYLMNGNILDVGCGVNFLKKFEHFGPRYFGVDFKGYYLKEEVKHQNFYTCDLNKNKLPFEDNSFDNVMCTDVLEHLHYPHRFILELFRVSKGNVIISLPNNWPQYFWDIIIGKEIIKKKGYGLFAEEQQAGQRHVHFFNFEHACQFLQANCANNFQIKDIRFIFEYANDGLISSIPLIGKIYNILGKVEEKHLCKKFKLNHFSAKMINFILKVFFIFIYIPNVLLTSIFYGFPKIRFYNLFCRQIWFFYSKDV